MQRDAHLTFGEIHDTVDTSQASMNKKNQPALIEEPSQSAKLKLRFFNLLESRLDDEGIHLRLTDPSITTHCSRLRLPTLGRTQIQKESLKTFWVIILGDQ